MSFIASQVTAADPKNFQGWALVDSKTFTSAVPSGSFDISNCDKFMIDISITSTTGSSYLIFNTDSSSNYRRTSVYSNSTGSASGSVLSESGIVLTTSSVPHYANIVFDKNTKHGVCQISNHDGTTLYANETSIKYIGSAAMTSLVFSGTSTITGIVKVYKWQDIKPLDLSSYELVKEYNLSAQSINDTITGINGDLDDSWYIEYHGMCNSTGTILLVQLNADATTSNYSKGTITQSGTTISGSTSTTYDGFQVNSVGVSGRYEFSRTFLKLKTGAYRFAQTYQSFYLPDATTNFVQTICGIYKNTSTQITSLKLYSTSTMTGIIRVYKLVKSHLISTNPNLLTVWSKYVDANTIQLQPGEIEINGAICQVTTPINITLSGNLKSGLTEASSTYYYLYAVRSLTGRSLTYMFDTVAPTVDRYGNTVSSFQDCDFSKAWFHPTLGINYRYIGQVYNNSSSNILSFDKMRPGYWESSWSSFSTTGQLIIPHGFGKIIYNSQIQMIGNTSASSTNCKLVPAFFVNGSDDHGWSCNNISTNATSSTLPAYLATAGVFQTSSWQTTGYYKIIIKE